MSGSNFQNPARSGDYLIYGIAAIDGERRFVPLYRIDLHPEGSDRIRTVVSPTNCPGLSNCSTEAIAIEVAVDYGLTMVDSFR